MGHRRWAYSAENDQTIVITCPGTGKIGNQMLTQPPVGLLEVPMGCTAQSDLWIFQASFKKSVVKETAGVASSPTPYDFDIFNVTGERKSLVYEPHAGSTSRAMEELVSTLLRSGKGTEKINSLSKTIYQIKEEDKDRIDSEQYTEVRYPVEIPVTSILLILGIVLFVLWHQWDAKKRIMDVKTRVALLESRMALHEEAAVIEDEI